MQHPTGRHHRQCRTLTGRLWALFALTLASVLAAIFIPNTPVRAAIEPAPRRTELPPTRPLAPTRTKPNAHGHRRNRHDDPDEPGGALVRPYMPPLVPRPRMATGDLLAPPSDDLDDLAEVIRTYLRVRG